MSLFKKTPEQLAEQMIEEGRRSGATELDLSGLGLTTLPESLGQLTALHMLRLENNQLTALPESLGQLAALQYLSLTDNQLTTLPESLGQLTALQYLSLADNQLITLPESLGQLTALKTLRLDDNRLTTLPESLGQLTVLEWLSVNDNQLTTLPEALRQLTALLILHLHNNQLTTLPESLEQLTALRELSLRGNHALGLPPEVLANNGRPSEILDYYYRIHPPGRAPGKRAGAVLRELKMILVGRGEVGKSSLVDVLQGMPFVPGKAQTEGIAITPWKAALGDGEATIHTWDFGGQEIMHGTHQFFLTHRTLYLVVVDWRHDRQNADAEHWLKYVRAFGGDSTAFVVMNKQGANREHAYETDRAKLARKYGVAPEHFFRTDCEDGKSIDTLRAAIFEEAGKMLTVGELFPPEFLPIRQRLGEMKEKREDFLSEESYRRLCRELRVPEQEGKDEYAIALRWLTDLGTVVSFPEDARLSHLTVLNPEWVTAGIYRVLNDARLRDLRHGELTFAELARILPADRWPKQHHGYLIDLMRRFDLCFPLGENEETLLVPELLRDAEPALPGWEAAECLVFQYQYPLLPHGLVPRFITRTHAHSHGRDRWRSGVVLAHDGAEAVVRADHDTNEVTVWVKGPHADQRRALLAVVRSEFATIHQRVDKLEVIERVAVPGHPAVLVSYADILQDERDEETTVRVTIAGKRVDWPLAEILNGVENAEVRVRRGNKEERLGDAPIHHHHYPSGTQPSFPMGDHITQNIHGGTFYGPVAAKMGDVSNVINGLPGGEKKELLERLQTEATALLKALPEGEQDKAASKLKTLVDQASAKEPERDWYSLSAKGLLEASKWTKDFTGNIAGTIGQLGKLLWPDFTLPAPDGKEKE